MKSLIPSNVFDRRKLEALRPEILARLEEFRLIPSSRWIRELAVCLLTPQSSPVRAEAAMQLLEREGFFEGALQEGRIAEILRTPEHYVRFHNVKAKRLLEFRLGIPKIEEILGMGRSPQEERRELVQWVKGYSWKEASHALRNIGRRNLAILDRHILKHLVQMGVIEGIPPSLNESRYLSIEDNFRDFCGGIGEEMDVLDLFFWASEAGLVFK